MLLATPPNVTKKSLLKHIAELDLFNETINGIIDRFKSKQVEDSERESLTTKIVSYFIDKFEFSLNYYEERKYFNRETLNDVELDIRTILSRYFNQNDFLTKLIEVRPIGLIERDTNGKYVDAGDGFHVRFKRILGVDVDIVVEYAWKVGKYIHIKRKYNGRKANA